MKECFLLAVAVVVMVVLRLDLVEEDVVPEVMDLSAAVADAADDARDADVLLFDFIDDDDDDEVVVPPPPAVAVARRDLGVELLLLLLRLALLPPTLLSSSPRTDLAASRFDILLLWMV